MTSSAQRPLRQGSNKVAGMPLPENVVNRKPSTSGVLTLTIG